MRALSRKVQDPAEESAERVETRLILQHYPAKRGKAGLKPGTKVWTVDRNDGKWDIFEGKVLPKAIKGKGGKGVPTPSGTQRVEMKSGSGRGSICSTAAAFAAVINSFTALAALLAFFSTCLFTLIDAIVLDSMLACFSLLSRFGSFTMQAKPSTSPSKFIFLAAKFLPKL